MRFDSRMQPLLGSAPHDDSSQEDQERNTPEKTPNCVESAPPSQQVRKFCSPRVQSRIKQTLVRWKNDDQSERHDRPEKQPGDDDRGITTLPTADDAADAAEYRQRRLHNRAAFVTWGEFPN